MSSFFNILEDAAEEFPEKPLYIFPETRWRPEEIITYGDLLADADIMAGCLQELTRPGDRALLLFPTGSGFWKAFFACLSSGVIAVPLRVPNLNRTNDHLERVCRDCTPSVLITDAVNAELLRRRADKHPYFEGRSVLVNKEASDTLQNPNRPTRITNPIGFLQYTSGSTSQPKGVQITHANLIANATMIRDRMQIRVGEDCTVTWLPHYHDMGLVGTYLGTLFTKITAWCLPPEDFALQPERWLRLISEHRASVCGAPDFAYRMCVERVSPEQLADLDLSSWRVAFNGAERIRPTTMRQFLEKFSPFGFREETFFPCYGLGEATLMVTGGPASRLPVVSSVSTEGLQASQILPPSDASDVTELAGCGQVFPDCRVMVLSQASGLPVGDEEIGHVVVSGANVTPGYFHRPDLNDETFIELSTNGTTERFLRTGDLGFLSKNELFITGRSREMMVFRGRNYHPEDLEEQVWKSHEALQSRGTVAFSIDHDEKSSLIIAAEVQRSFLRSEDLAKVIGVIRHAVIESFGINPEEVLLLQPATIPWTTSGKPCRWLLRDHYLDKSLSYVERG